MYCPRIFWASWGRSIPELKFISYETKIDFEFSPASGVIDHQEHSNSRYLLPWYCDSSTERLDSSPSHQLELFAVTLDQR